MNRILFLVAGLLCFQLSIDVASAAQVKAIKGKKILIDLQGDAFKKGDVLNIIGPSGKVVGIAKITHLKGNAAQALIKGKAKKGFALKLRSSKSKGAATASRSSRPSAPSAAIYGGFVGFNSSSADVKLPSNGPEVSLSGTGFSLKGFMDYPLFSWLSFRGLVGLEQFNVGGESDTVRCGGECTAEINYLGVDLWGRYVMGSGSLRPWAGLGFNLMFPVSKKATALDENSITNTSVLNLGGGFDWMMSDKSYVPFQIEYNLYPSSEGVTATAISARVGFGKSF